MNFENYSIRHRHLVSSNSRCCSARSHPESDLAVGSAVHSETSIGVSYPLNASETFAVRGNLLETSGFVKFSYTMNQGYWVRNKLNQIAIK